MKMTIFSCLATTTLTCYAADDQSSPSFGHHYAVLNPDLINFTVAKVQNTTAGERWIKVLQTGLTSEPRDVSLTSD